MNRWTAQFIGFFFDGSSWPLFAMLFGIGFAIWMDKSMKKGNSLARFAWRLTILFIITAIFFTFVQERPILFFYAIMGFPLMLFFRYKPITLLIWAIVLFIYSMLHPYVIDKIEQQQKPVITKIIQPAPHQQTTNQPSEWDLAAGNYLKISRLRFLDIKETFVTLYKNNWLYSILSCFLLGLWVWRKRLIQEYEKNRLFWKRLMWWGLSIGLIGNLLHLVLWYMRWKKIIAIAPLADLAWLKPIEEISNLALSFFYAALITILWNNRKTKSNLFFNSFKSTGKIALTNYFLQYTLVTLIFYPYGFNLDEKLHMQYVFLIAIAIYIFQVFFSILWLKKYEYGPLEWLWRSLTYFKIQRMKKNKPTEEQLV